MNYNLRSFNQEMMANEVVLPPFVYPDNWANIEINFARIQNFIGVGYKLSFGNFSIIPQFDVLLSFANKFDVSSEFNENPINTPVSEVTEPDFDIGFSEYGFRASLLLGYELNDNLEIFLAPSRTYGEMELIVQDSPIFTGGDNKTIGLEFDFGLFYRFAKNK